MFKHFMKLNMQNLSIPLHAIQRIQARTYLQLPLRDWGASNTYLLVLSSWKVNIAKNPIAFQLEPSYEGSEQSRAGALQLSSRNRTDNTDNIVCQIFQFSSYKVMLISFMIIYVNSQCYRQWVYWAPLCITLKIKIWVVGYLRFIFFSK